MLKIVRIFLVSFLSVLILINPIAADIDSVLDNIVSGVYVQGPGLYKSPTTTTLSFGSLSFRLKNDLLGRPIVNFRAPQASLSCSGMDFDAGLLSLLNLDMFGQMLSQAGASLAWGIMIGLVYSLPGIGEAFQKLNEWARMLQQLGRSPCELGKFIGTQLGAPIGQAISDSLGLNKVEEVVQQTGKPFEEALKKVLDYIKLSDFYRTIPYGVLSQVGLSDREMQDLFASFFGVLDIYLVDNNGNPVSYNPSLKMSNACGGDPCSEKNIKVKIFTPLTKSLEDILYGGTVMLYSCSNLEYGQRCSGITTYTANVTGLIPKFASKLNMAVDSLAEQGTVSYSEELNAYSKMVPQLLDMISFAVLLKKNVSDADAKRIVNTMSEYLALVSVAYLIESMKGYIGAALGSNVTDEVAQTIKQYQDMMNQGETALYEKLKRVNERFITIQQAFENYKAIRAQIDPTIGQVFGKGAVVFGKNPLGAK
ncbi:conjugal transfer protein TraH [Thermodesulfovibrio sp. TK110]